MSSHEEALGPEVPLPVDFLLGSTSEPPDTIVGSESGIPVDWKGRDSSWRGECWGSSPSTASSYDNFSTFKPFLKNEMWGLKEKLSGTCR